MNKLYFLFLILTSHSTSYAGKCSYEIQSVNHSNGSLFLKVKTEGIKLEQIAYFLSNLPTEISNETTSIKSSNKVDCWPLTSDRFSGDIKISTSELAILLNADQAIKAEPGTLISGSEIQFKNLDGIVIKTNQKIIMPKLFVPSSVHSISDPFVSKNDEIVKEVSGEFYSFVPASKKPIKSKLNLTALTKSCNLSSPPQCEFVVIQILQDRNLEDYFQQEELNEINNYQLIEQKGFLKQVGKLPGTAIGWSLRYNKQKN